MTPQHHTGLAIPFFSYNLPPPALVLQYKDAPICPSTASQVAKIICIHPIWMWDAVNGCSEPQPWHRNIIQARPYPIFPKTHPHLHSYYSIRMHPYAHPQHLKVQRHFVYIQYGCGMQSMGVWSLNHDTATVGKRVPACHLMSRYSNLSVVPTSTPEGLSGDLEVFGCNITSFLSYL